MGGANIYTEVSYIHERSELRAKRVMSEASINQLGVGGGGGGGAISPLHFFEFRIPESESERNLTNYFIIFLLLFY